MAKEPELTIAVAANFAPTLEVIAKKYQNETGTKVSLVTGSTGKLYLQIKHGAPFDLFFAADSKHPKQLVKEGFALQNSLMTYATARLVMISHDQAINETGEAVLQQANFHWLAMANPGLAPCGLAAEQVIDHLHLEEALSGKISQGENANQVLSFVMSKAADVGFVTYSQVKGRLPNENIWIIPQRYYQPIVEQAVIIKNAKNSNPAKRFLKYIQQDIIRKLIRNAGNQ
jgi:molybdate transport system substrate-binding protein